MAVLRARRYPAAKCRDPVSVASAVFLLMTALLLADMTFVSKAMRRTIVVNLSPFPDARTTGFSTLVQTSEP